ncbi:hypothetical protein BHM03_00039159 [Ensete ventricosum]|nr:hypothetical protein BHM03_00039159 [Ensete ventricosum]
MVALGQRKKMVTTTVVAVVGSSSTEGWEAMTEEVGMVDCEELQQRYSGWRRAKEGEPNREGVESCSEIAPHDWGAESTKGHDWRGGASCGQRRGKKTAMEREKRKVERVLVGINQIASSYHEVDN